MGRYYEAKSWSWIADWCRNKGVNPHDPYWWRRALREYQKAHQREVTRMDKDGMVYVKRADRYARENKELKAELTQANERNKQFERFLKEKNYINFYEAWEHRILGGNK